MSIVSFKILVAIVLLVVAIKGSCIFCKTIFKSIKKPKGLESFATVMIFNEQKEILLLRRAGKSFGSGLYGLPGGKIESGESARDAARRELDEEVGLQGEDFELVHVINRQGPKAEFYVFFFRIRTWQGIPCNKEAHKCDALGWFALDQLPDNILPAHRQAIKLSQQGIMYSEHGWE